MRYGIYGGSFDPVHLGHVAAADEVREARGLAKVWLVPAGQAPHKPACGASFAHRLAMVRLAISGLEGLDALDLEGRREGPSYTVDTIEQLERTHRGDSLELLVGADMLADLPNWHRAKDLIRRVRVVAFGRPGTGSEEARQAYEAAFGPGNFEWQELIPLEISSSEIRRRLAAGTPATGLLDSAVEAYARENGLYKLGG